MTEVPQGGEVRLPQTELSGSVLAATSRRLLERAFQVALDSSPKPVDDRLRTMKFEVTQEADTEGRTVRLEGEVVDPGPGGHRGSVAVQLDTMPDGSSEGHVIGHIERGSAFNPDGAQEVNTTGAVKAVEAFLAGFGGEARAIDQSQSIAS